MLDLFDQRTSELSSGLEQQAEQIKALQDQLEKLAQEHQNRSQAIQALNESKERGQELIDSLRTYLAGLEKIDSDFVKSFIGRINEVVYGVTGSTNAIASDTKETTKAPKRSAEKAAEPKPAEAVPEPEAKPLAEAATEAPEDFMIDIPPESEEESTEEDGTKLTEGSRVKVLTDKFGTEGEVGEVKSIVEKPSGTKYKVKLSKGLFTFLEHEIVQTEEAAGSSENSELEEIALPY